MEFLFRKALALIGKADDPTAQKRLFDRFGGSSDLFDLYQRMEKVATDPRLGAPDVFESDFPDPNMVAGYLDHPSEVSRYQRLYEESCLDSDVLMAEAASVSVILNLYQEKPTRAPKSCRRRAYSVVEAQCSKPVPKSKTTQSASPGCQELKEEANPFEKRSSLADPSHCEKEFEDNFEPKTGIKVLKRQNISSETTSKKRTGYVGYLLYLLLWGALFYGFGPQLLQILKKSASESALITRPESEDASNVSEPEFFTAPVSDKIAVSPPPSDVVDEFAPPEPIEFDAPAEPASSVMSAKTGTADESAPWKSLSLLSDNEKATKGIESSHSEKTPLQKNSPDHSMLTIPAQNNNVFKK